MHYTADRAKGWRKGWRKEYTVTASGVCGPLHYMADRAKGWRCKVEFTVRTVKWNFI